jgi:SAM-dependent methyltransferase
MDAFYKKFEDKFRGHRSTIKSRLTYYLPLLEQVEKSTDSLKVLDLGCGRGEWLELLTEKGYQAQGVDLDLDMLEECKKLNLNHHHGDALEYLKSQASDSFDVISSFHLIEHLPFDVLQALVIETLRVLKPTGILILETPNSENLVVGTSSFYLDPTHQRPLPAQLVSFMTIFAGFERSTIQFLNAGVEEHCKASLYKVVYGVGLDYTVIAQKNASKNLDGFFKQKNNHDLNALVREFDERLALMEFKINSMTKVYSLVVDPIYSVIKKLNIPRVVRKLKSILARA